jgi:hypothetical protein
MRQIMMISSGVRNDEGVEWMSKWLSLPLVLCLLVASVGCKDFYPDLYGDDDDDDDDEPSVEEIAQAEETEQETDSAYDEEGEPVPAGDSVPSDFAGVVWMHHNVSGWDETAHLDAGVSGSRVILDYDKADEWPAVQNVVASAWVFFVYDGVWHASTFDYMRPGQTTKGAGFYIPIGGQNWRPSSGESIGFMVSGLARDHRRNVSERSNVDMVVWP